MQVVRTALRVRLGDGKKETGKERAGGVSDRKRWEERVTADATNSNPTWKYLEEKRESKESGKGGCATDSSTTWKCSLLPEVHRRVLFHELVDSDLALGAKKRRETRELYVTDGGPKVRY